MDEVEKNQAHDELDKIGVPKVDAQGTPYELNQRIVILRDRLGGKLFDSLSDKTRYEQIEDAIKGASMTYLPVLLSVTVSTCIEKRVFLSGGIQKFFNRILEAGDA